MDFGFCVAGRQGMQWLCVMAAGEVCAVLSVVAVGCVLPPWLRYMYMYMYSVCGDREGDRDRLGAGRETETETGRPLCLGHFPFPVTFNFQI